MVMTRAIFDDQETPLRRLSGRGHGFPLYHERELPPAHGLYSPSRMAHLGAHENRIGDQVSENDSNSPGARPRSRIPVACGRCRKRKIRCSGDQGGPCSNCKSAGNEQCLFLRVSSTEAQMKSESAGYDYDLSAGSRLNCRMVPCGSPSYGMGIDSYQYRNNSLTTYQFPINPIKSYYPYNDFEENVDYGLNSYSMMPADHLAIPNYAASPGRGWTTPTPQLPKNSLFLEQPDPAYSHGQLPYQGSTSVPLRPTTSPEPKCLSLHGLNSSLPTPSSNNDRVLPIPAANRQPHGSFLRSTDSLLPTSQTGYPPYSGLMSASILSSLKSQSNATQHESSYMPMSSSSPGSLTSSQLTYSSGQLLNSQSQEMYQSNNSESLFTPVESSESSYGHSSPTSKRGSNHSHATNTEGSLPSQSCGTLVNGHAYIPSPYQASYPPPPIEVQSSAPPRNPSTSISAA